MKRNLKYFFYICIFICIGISIYMRCWLLNMPYEYDELFTAVTTDPLESFAWIYQHYLVVDVHPPLYNSLLWIWNHCVPFGPELWLRLPSVFSGIGALLCAWFMFPKRLGKTTRWIFISLLSCNLYLMCYAQQARSYMLVFLLAIPVTFMWLDFMFCLTKEKIIPIWKWTLLTGFMILLCWTHYFGALLVAVCCMALLIKSYFHKSYLKSVLCVCSIEIILFLPWIIPNIIAQFEYHRFGGNWWANEAIWKLLPSSLYIFFVHNTGSIVLSMLLFLSFYFLYNKHKKLGPFFRKRELMWLGGISIGAILVVGIISFRTFLLIGRYYIAFLPAVYLIFSILFAPLLRRYVGIQCVLVLFLVTNLVIFKAGYKEWAYSPQIPTRIMSQIYRDYYRGQEIFVIAVEGFPPAAMPAMYGFYVNRIYGLNVPVTELFSLDESTLQEVLKRRENALIWMPNCTMDKLLRVSTKWHRSLGIYGRMSTACVLKISD